MPSQQTAQEVGLAGSVGGAGVGTAVALGAVSGPIGAVVGLGIALVEGIFSISAHHSQAVKTEAAALNDAVSREIQAFTSIFAAANSGQVTPQEASAAIDQSVSQYDQVVYNTYGVKQKSGNGADVIKKQIQKWATAAKGLLAGNGGTFTSDYLPSHAGFNGAQTFTLSYSPTQTSTTINPFGFGSSSSSSTTTTAVGNSISPAPSSSSPSLVTIGIVVLAGVLVLRLL